MNEECHKAGFLDYLFAIGLGVGEKLVEDAIKTEEEKPCDQRNDVAIILGKLLSKPLFSYVRYEINKDLCNPVA